MTRSRDVRSPGNRFKMNIKRFNDYEEAVSYILEIPRFSSKNDMAATKAFLELVGEPDIRTVIHVAGTNGKGSTCAFLNSIYMKQKKTTGLFTSPHLCDIRERIRINNVLITKEEFLDCANHIIDLINSEKVKEDYHPSFFEFIFFMAVRYFGMKNVDVAIYETGLGGRLDATNSLMRKSACIITQIGMDHMEYLGNSIKEIAYEKAGIMSSGVPVIYWKDKKESYEVIERRAKELDCPLYPVSKENASDTSFNKKNIDFSYKYGYDKSAMFTVHSYAHYQVFNALMSLKTIEVLEGKDSIDTSFVREGLSDMIWPGRMEEIEKNIFVDGGHNEDGIAAFIDSVKDDGCMGKRRLIYSAVNDKRIESISMMLAGCNAFDSIGICAMKSGRATKIDELKKIFETAVSQTDKNIELKVYEHVKDAYESERKCLKEGDRLYICGSLYLVADILEYTGNERS